MQSSIKLSSKRVIEATIERLKVVHLFDVLSSEIRCKNGNGIIVFQGLQDHTADSIKSLEDFQIAWVEEAQSISERSLRLLRPTMRSGSELWFSWNPEFDDDPVELLFADSANDAGMVVVDVNYNNNPFFPQELAEEMGRDKRLMSPQMFEHTWHGAYITSDMGSVFKWQWFKTHEFVFPFNLFERIVCSWDTAYKTAEHNDPSACTVWGLKGSCAYLLHVINERLEYPALKRLIIDTAKQFTTPSAAPEIMIEDKASGQSLLQELRHEGGMKLIAIAPLGDKVTRAVACCAAIEAGLVYVPPKADWLQEYRKQLTKFNFNKDLLKKQHDDMVDSTSQFINWWQNFSRADSQFERLLKDKYSGYRR